MLAHPATNFLSMAPISELKVTRGDNVLDSSFQYVVRGDEGDKLLVVKFYDKLTDLVARDGSHIVGSRIDSILGSKRHLTLFESRIRKAQYAGMTRVEISICHAALEKFRPDLPSVRTLWHLKMQNAIDLIINKVLNHKDILPLVYRKLSLPILLGSLGLCSYNLMVIGRRYSWIVNA